MKALRFLIKCAIGLLALVGILFLLYFFRGSLEEFPTEEQEDKVRTVSGVMIGVIAMAELLLFSVLKLIGKKKKEE